MTECMTSIPATSFGYPQSKMRAWAECINTSVNCSCGTQFTVTPFWFIHVLWCVIRTCSCHGLVFWLTASTWPPACFNSRVARIQSMEERRSQVKKKVLKFGGFWSSWTWCCSPIEGCQHSECVAFILQSSRSYLKPVRIGWYDPWNHWVTCTMAASHPRRLESSDTPLREPPNMHAETLTVVWSKWMPDSTGLLLVKHNWPLDVNCTW